ncbi:MAG: hypothetical protein ACREXP_02375, partial [Steroidobacteraceae bacterium]
MPFERAPQRKPAAVERRPAPAIASATSASPVHARALDSSSLSSGGVVQRFANVSAPHDRAEVEAVSTARTVMRMSAPSSAAPIGVQSGRSIQRAAASTAPAVNPKPAAAKAPSGGGGGNLPAPVRKFMEPRFGA